MTAPEHDPSVATMMPLAKIRPGNNPRRYFDRKKHEELVESLRLRGLLQPMIVRPAADAEGLFAIVAGERRYRAALEAFGPDGIAPVAIRALSDQEALEAAIDENDMREDASETEQADAAARVLAACGGDRSEAAKRLGWSMAKLDRRLALANLSDSVKAALDERRIKVGHAELLAVVPADKQDRALATILEAGLDVARTRDLLMRVTQSLAAATFDKTECTTCPFNSAAQRALFETHVDDGHCTNPGCYQLKTEAADAARQAELDRAAEAAAPAAVVEEAKAGTCRICGCTDDRACREGCTWTDATHTLCSNPDCMAKAVARSTEGAAVETPAPAAAQKPAGAAPTPKSAVTAKSIAARVSDVRESAWRTALARALAGNSENANRVVLIAAMSGTLPNIKAATLTSRAGALVDATFPSLDYKGKIAAIRALPLAQAQTAVNAIAAAYAKDVPTFAHVADLAREFGVDLRDSWQVDQSFLGRFTKDELKFIAQECGLVEHMGAKPFANLLKAKNPDIVAGMLNATGFAWARRLPSSMTLDGQYGPPPTDTAPTADIAA